MAEKRMFAKAIVLSDAFLDMPMSARCLYFTLGMLADDDGFVSSPKAIMRQCGASLDDLNILLAKRYLLSFESGVIVIKHWRINNYLRQDRYTETTYLEEKAMLAIDAKGSYVEAGNADFGIPPGIPPVDHPVYPDKNRLDKDSEDKDREDLTEPVGSVCRTKDVRRIVEAWNTLGLQQVQKVTGDSKRGAMLRARVNEYGVDKVLEAIEKVRQSDFLKGGSQDGWFITFDWFVRPNNFPKVLEGNYDNKASSKPRRSYTTAAETERQTRIDTGKLAELEAAMNKKTD